MMDELSGKAQYERNPPNHSDTSEARIRAYRQTIFQEPFIHIHWGSKVTNQPKSRGRFPFSRSEFLVMYTRILRV
jgi:hypothetical protein